MSDTSSCSENFSVMEGDNDLSFDNVYRMLPSAGESTPSDIEILSPPRRLNDEQIANIKCGRTITDNATRVNCIDFCPDGMAMIVSNSDDSIAVYNMHNGLKDKGVCVNSKKYGVGLIRYGGNPNTAIHSSTKIDNNLRYLNLHDNKYIRYFTGHTGKVICLHVCSTDDKVISGSEDGTIRLWDLRTQHCQGILQIPGRPIANFDTTGEVLIVSNTADSLRMYDMRNLDKGPFVAQVYEKQSDQQEVVNIDLSPCGQYVLQNTNDGVIRLIDVMTAEEIRCLRGHQNPQRENMEASFSPDGKYIFCGSSDSFLYGWSVENGELLARAETTHDSFVKVCRWNPRHAMLATGCTKICLWSVHQEMPVFPEIKQEIIIKEEPLF